MIKGRWLFKNVCYIIMIWGFYILQLKWENSPTCAYPEELRGELFTDLNPNELTFCYGVASDDAKVSVYASTTSENAFDRGNFMQDMYFLYVTRMSWTCWVTVI